MSLSTPKPQLKTGGSTNEMLQLSERQRNQDAVINNDWVPATQISKMRRAEPVRLVGPLTLRWYRAKAKSLIAKTIFSTRSTS